MPELTPPAERILEVRAYLGLSRRKFEQETGVPDYNWHAVESGRAQPTAAHINAIGARWPQFRFWILTGEEIPEAGQISPKTEQLRKDSQREKQRTA